LTDHHHRLGSADSATIEECAAVCVAKDGGCIAFNWVTSSASVASARYSSGALPSASCELSGWHFEYSVLPNATSVYYTKTLPRNDTAWKPKVDYLLRVPTGGVELTSGPFATAFATNLVYLGQFPVDDILFWFRRRAGVANPPGATTWGWDGALEPNEVSKHPYMHTRTHTHTHTRTHTHAPTHTRARAHTHTHTHTHTYLDTRTRARAHTHTHIH
jgi:hypothetical protein